MASISVLCSIVELRRNYLAHTMEYRRPLNDATDTCFVDCKTERLLCCDVLILATDGTITPLRCRTNSCDRTPELGEWHSSAFPVNASCHSYRPTTNRASFGRNSFTNIAKTSVDTAHWFFRGDEELYHSTFFVTHQCEVLLVWCYPSEMFTTSYMSAWNWKLVSYKKKYSELIFRHPAYRKILRLIYSRLWHSVIYLVEKQ
jgi:hypothetical protein